jgi:hypothetical protein
MNGRLATGCAHWQHRGHAGCSAHAQKAGQIHKSGAGAHAKFVAARPQTPLNFSAISMSRRGASDREGRSGWQFALASTSAVSVGGARKVVQNDSDGSRRGAEPKCLGMMKCNSADRRHATCL